LKLKLQGLMDLFVVLNIQGFDFLNIETKKFSNCKFFPCSWGGRLSQLQTDMRLLGRESLPRCFSQRRVREFLLFQCEEDLSWDASVRREHLRDGFRVVENERLLEEALGWGVYTGRKEACAASDRTGFGDVFDLGDGVWNDAQKLRERQWIKSSLGRYEHGHEMMFAQGEYIFGTRFPELFLNENRRIVGGTAFNGRTISAETRLHEGRFVVDLDEPWDLMECFRMEGRKLMLTILRISAGRQLTTRIFHIDTEILQEADLPIKTTTDVVVESSCEFCMERRRWCECSLSMRERMSDPKPKRFLNWVDYVRFFRQMPPWATVSTVKLTKQNVTFAWSSADIWRNSEGQTDALNQIAPSYLARVLIPFQRLSSQRIQNEKEISSRSTDGPGPLKRAKPTTESDATPKEQRTFSCDLCPRTFSRRSYLAGHIARAHRAQENFCCESCEKTFCNQSNLNRHVRSVHDRVRNYHCCARSFFSRSDYLRHLKRLHRVSRDTETLLERTPSP